MGCHQYGSGLPSSPHPYLDFLSGFTHLAFEVSFHRRQQFPFHPEENGCPSRHIYRTVGLLLRHLCLWGLRLNTGMGPLQGSTSRSQLGKGFFKEVLLLYHSPVCPGLWQAEPGFPTLGPGWLGYKNINRSYISWGRRSPYYIICNPCSCIIGLNMNMNVL
jgi:hypothetical protein